MAKTISIQEACKRLGKPKQTIHFWIGNGTIPKESVYIVPVRKTRIEIEEKIIKGLETLCHK